MKKIPITKVPTISKKKSRKNRGALQTLYTIKKQRGAAYDLEK